MYRIMGEKKKKWKILRRIFLLAQQFQFPEDRQRRFLLVVVPFLSLFSCRLMRIEDGGVRK